jgi:hypothetical protein
MPSITNLLYQTQYVSATVREVLIQPTNEDVIVPAPVFWTRFCSSGGQLHQPFLTGFEG